MRPAAVLAALCACLLAAACEAPSSSSAARRERVLDDPTAILDAGAARRIRAYLAWVGEEYGVEYHVVVGALGGASPERRALELFEQRAIGGADGGRGLLLVVDPSDQLVRVEVGYALESYVTDVDASRMLSDYLAPYFRSGNTSAGIEASIEALVDTLRPHLVAARTDEDATGVADEPRLSAAVDQTERTAAAPVEHEQGRRPPSGGGGASLDLLRELPDDRLDDATRAALRAILVPQPDPRQARDLEIALLHKGLYFQEAALYDDAWRRATRPGFAPARLREIARQWDRPYEILVEEPVAVAYYLDAQALGPTFLRRQDTGWIIDASEGARTIIYDYSNQGWYARRRLAVPGAAPARAAARAGHAPGRRVRVADGVGAESSGAGVRHNSPTAGATSIIRIVITTTQIALRTVPGASMSVMR